MNREHLSSALRDIDQRLCNWSRWAYSRLGGSGHCGSAEHHYRPEKYADEAKLERTAMPIDGLDAEIVEKAICRIAVQSLPRRFIRSFYEKRHDWRKTCRLLHIRWDQMETIHRTVLYALEVPLHQETLRARAETVTRLLTTATAA